MSCQDKDKTALLRANQIIRKDTYYTKLYEKRVKINTRPQPKNFHINT